MLPTGSGAPGDDFIPGHGSTGPRTPADIVLGDTECIFSCRGHPCGRYTIYLPPTISLIWEQKSPVVEGQIHNQRWWARGGRVSSVLTRPQGAPRWSDAAREAFREDWYAQYTGDGVRAGGTPILEDGMDLKKIDFSASDQQYIQGAKLSFSTVAAAFHVNPTMVGVLDNANYSNVREFRKMLYGDTLGPLIAQIESALNAWLLPIMRVDEGIWSLVVRPVRPPKHSTE